MSIYMILFTTALYLSAASDLGLDGPEQATSDQICNLRESDAPVELRSTTITLRLLSYAPTELLGPPPCADVNLFILDREAERHLLRLQINHEDNEQYETYYRVIVDGQASFDPDLNAVRFNISSISGWTLICIGPRRVCIGPRRSNGVCGGSAHQFPRWQPGEPDHPADQQQ